LKVKLSRNFVVAHSQPCMHEFVLSGVKQKERGVATLNLAKRLLDYGVHAPTVYFPLVVPEAMMIEPTETENKETLDRFAEIMVTIDKEIDENKELVMSAPLKTPVGRLDEATAARKPNLRWTPNPQAV
ncbi:MAG TPA: hypothetical protein PKH78_04125, partial [Candidatus Obscuribacter sp.]|nr:hypothetical protein [Candidatus Obscuribacter sp.]